MTVDITPNLDTPDLDAPNLDAQQHRAARIDERTKRLLATDAQFADTRPRQDVADAVQKPGMRLAQVVETVMEGYADRPALGRRAYELETTDGRTSIRLLPRFVTSTYRELWDRTAAIAATLHGHHDMKAGDFVAILGFTSSDYTALDIACIRTGLVSVPLQTSASVGQLTPIIDETRPRIVAAAVDLLENAVDAILAGTAPELVIVFDYHPESDDEREKFEAAAARLAAAPRPIAIETLASIVDRGAPLPVSPLYVPSDDDNPLATIFYTSGSTGAPKGAMYTERMFVTPWLASTGLRPGADIHPAVHINFMPMSHLYGRHWLSSTLAAGGTAYFVAKSDLSTLFDDLALVRPTSMNFVPRVCDMVFQKYQSELASRSDQGPTAQADVMTTIRDEFFGGRLVSAICGTAPVSAEMREFIETCLDLPLGDGYGSTEAGMAIIETKVQRPTVIDYKLIDVPELGYFRTDTPYPRGELLLKTTSMFPGYYKRPEITAEMFTKDGFYLTGDVMAEIGPDQLVYVDRRKNVLKLSQGEFVAVSKLEALYVNSPLVAQIYVYGNSERSFLLAVVAPALDHSAAEILDSITAIGKEAGVNSYEIPRDIIVVDEPFSQQNGLLSGVGKLLRPALKDHFGPRLEELYRSLADGQADELRAIRNVDPNAPALGTVGRAARALLGCGIDDIAPDVHFTDLGGDSLSALTFSDLLQEIFHVDVPVGVIVSAANDLAHIASYIESARTSGAPRPTFASVHGRGAVVARADELTLDKFISDDLLSGAPSLERPTGTPTTVLLTGANGYLGRFLCLEWLERVAESNGTVVAIVRGSTAEAARRRLDDAFDSGDPELAAHFRELATRHLEVLAGDIGDERLGLPLETWDRLADTVDHIVHPAALVNHVLPYTQLFGPNVVGTAELIRLALTSRMKPIDYLSTVAVAAGVDPEQFGEDGDIRIISAERAVDESYANGYGTSKWAGEVLLREAHDLCGLPVAVFRSDMILAHSRYSGQLNVPDVFTRLILSLVLTGIAPRSFYVTDPDGTRRRAHYDGLPADFTAEAIATIGAEHTAGFHTFDVLNPHDDGISLDEFVDWMIEQGHPISRIDDYDEWFSRFDTAIRALPEKQRSHSLLPLMHAYAAPGEAHPGSRISADRFREAVRSAGVGTDNDIPHLTPALIQKYVADLELLGLIS